MISATDSARCFVVEDSSAQFYPYLAMRLFKPAREFFVGDIMLQPTVKNLPLCKHRLPVKKRNTRRRIRLNELFKNEVRWDCYRWLNLSMRSKKTFMISEVDVLWGLVSAALSLPGFKAGLNNLTAWWQNWRESRVSHSENKRAAWRQESLVTIELRWRVLKGRNSVRWR